MSSRVFFFVVALLSAALVGTVTAGYYVWSSRDGGVVQIGGPFTLTDHTGQAVTEETYSDTWKLVFFGYTYCPDFCPQSLTTVSVVMDQLGSDAERVTPIFITIDPERDTVEQLAAYHTHFHPSFQMLTGTREQIADVAKAYRVYYAKAESEEFTEYLMDHSTITYLMAPDGRYVAHFGHGMDPERFAEDLLTHISG